MASADLAAANGKRQQRPFVGPGEPAGNADARREARSCEAASFWRRILKNPEIKFGGSVTRADVLASLDRLAELGGRLDGPYRTRRGLRSRAAQRRRGDPAQAARRCDPRAPLAMALASVEQCGGEGNIDPIYSSPRHRPRFYRSGVRDPPDQRHAQRAAQRRLRGVTTPLPLAKPRGALSGTDHRPATQSRRTLETHDGEHPKAQSERPDSPWVCEYTDAAGRRRRKTPKTGLKKDADAIRSRVESELEQGQHIPHSEAVTVAALCDAFLKFQDQRLARERSALTEGG